MTIIRKNVVSKKDYAQQKVYVTFHPIFLLSGPLKEYIIILVNKGTTLKISQGRGKKEAKMLLQIKTFLTKGMIAKKLNTIVTLSRATMVNNRQPHAIGIKNLMRRVR
jgi:hypothetical protein